jgi:hypothetical protein
MAPVARNAHIVYIRLLWGGYTLHLFGLHDNPAFSSATYVLLKIGAMVHSLCWLAGVCFQAEQVEGGDPLPLLHLPCIERVQS